MKKIYHKLVRDKILQMIKANHEEPIFYTTTVEEGKMLLLNKLELKKNLPIS